MNTTMYAIIGCQHGHIEIFIQEMQELGFACAGLYERENRALAEAIAGKYGITLVDDCEQLLDDAVGIIGCASINSEKIDVIELCERHGKHVMVDKPAVVDEAGLERLKRVVERGRIQVGMLLTERFRPSIYTVKKHIDQGKLGDIVGISTRKPHRLNPSARPDWFFVKEQCGGILIDLLVHDFDLLRWLTGKEIKQMDGVVGKNILPQYPTFYNTVNLQVVMEDGIVMQLYADWHTPERSWTWGDGRIFVTGTKGFAELRLEGDPLMGKEPLLLEVTNEDEWAKVPLSAPPCTISEDFVRRIAGESSILTHESIIKASEAAIAADRRAVYTISEMKGVNR
ncbi:Gfo/Idh/MocA family protein [Paenibacillus sp. GCM10027626]|uniref:Gfo/Idh/MocA family protein n=1 Tax=Paenibacillus sp. GCM10027626 TaxID=3273411 RepID=UPI00362A82EC